MPFAWCCGFSRPSEVRDCSHNIVIPPYSLGDPTLVNPNSERPDVIRMLATANKSTAPFDLNGFSGWSRIVGVHDGDTCTAVLEVPGLGFRKLQVRLAGIDTAEMTSKDPVLKQAAIDARDLLIASVAPYVPESDKENKAKLSKYLDANIVIAWLECKGMDKYGRTLGVIRANPGDKSVNDILLERGLAAIYDGGNKHDAWASAAAPCLLNNQ